MIEIKSITNDDLQWPFREGLPQFSVRDNGWFTVKLDPFPCYPHERIKVELQLLNVTSLWAPETPMTIWLSEFDDEGHTNAFAQKIEDYYNKSEDKPKWHSHIFMAGKRTPINPYVTSNIVAHEYGHHVDYWIASRMFDDEELRDYERDEKFQSFYAEMRGIPYDKSYGARKWHTAIGEVIANDFRILVAGVQDDVWPHPYSHPYDVDDLDLWWSDQAEIRRALDD